MNNIIAIYHNITHPNCKSFGVTGCPGRGGEGIMTKMVFLLAEAGKYFMVKLKYLVQPNEFLVLKMYFHFFSVNF